MASAEGRRRGFSITEMVVAAFIAAVAGLALFWVFAGGARHALQTRNRAAAVFVAHSLVSEVDAHPFGADKPPWWPPETEPAMDPRSDDPTAVEEVVAVVDEVPQEMIFYKRMEFLNGSCIGNGTEPSDTVTITVSWWEASGGEGSGRERQELRLRVPTWREGVAR